MWSQKPGIGEIGLFTMLFPQKDPTSEESFEKPWDSLFDSSAPSDTVKYSKMRFVSGLATHATIGSLCLTICKPCAVFIFLNPCGILLCWCFPCSLWRCHAELSTGPLKKSTIR
jgi:hypothetical protein